MIKLKDILTEAVSKDTLWHVFDKWERGEIKTFAILKAPNFQTALERAKAESHTYTAEEISRAAGN